MEKDFEKMLRLSPDDMDLIIQALDQLKAADLPGMMIDIMFSSLLKPSKDASLKEKMEWETKQMKEQEEKKTKTEKHEKLKARVDILKAKIVLLNEFKKQKETETELKNPSRQISS